MIRKHKKGSVESKEIHRGTDIAVPKEAQAGRQSCRSLSKIRHEQRFLLQLEGQVCRNDGQRLETAEGIGNGEKASKVNRSRRFLGRASGCTGDGASE